jgi:hypothetical protein
MNRSSWPPFAVTYRPVVGAAGEDDRGHSPCFGMRTFVEPAFVVARHTGYPLRKRLRPQMD